jgi:murein DD-endopeptidase MepM/ murein hydrolase activator NlpD
MSIDVKNSITPPGQGISLNPADREADRAQIKILAQQFEAMLMTQMMREMRRSMLDESEDEGEDGFGSSALTDTGDIELAQQLSKTGGIGLTAALLKVFERQVPGGERADATSAAEAAAAVAATTAPAAVVATGHVASSAIAPAGSPAISLADVTASAPISSRYGWRNDPITGAHKFHQGIDIAVAYGRDVKSAAAGTVAFSGVMNGYGNTVVVDHEDGRQTRYAHLSQQLVRAGDVVAEGQILGKSGNSGRSTGPHLHFEMLVNGRPVDPTSAVAD